MLSELRNLKRLDRARSGREASKSDGITDAKTESFNRGGARGNQGAYSELLTQLDQLKRLQNSLLLSQQTVYESQAQQQAQLNAQSISIRLEQQLLQAQREKFEEQSAQVLTKYAEAQQLIREYEDRLARLASANVEIRPPAPIRAHAEHVELEIESPPKNEADLRRTVVKSVRSLSCA